MTKDELKLSLKKIDSLEDDLSARTFELKDAKQKKILYDATA